MPLFQAACSGLQDYDDDDYRPTTKTTDENYRHCLNEERMAHVESRQVSVGLEDSRVFPRVPVRGG